jgi:hypothetical protein
MNRSYIIIPLILLAAFGGVYWQHTQNADQQARKNAVSVAQAKAAEAAKKAETERQAREDAEKRTATRLAEEQKKEEEKRAKWDADSARIAADIANYTKQAADSAKEVAVIDKQLSDVRAAQKALDEQAFAAAHDVEVMRIQRRAAEMEIQRMTEIIARKAGNTTIAQIPSVGN